LDSKEDGGDIMTTKDNPNVSLGGKIVKEKGNGGDQVHGHEKENKNGKFNTNPKSGM
jgi:hypothetical protein